VKTLEKIATLTLLALAPACGPEVDVGDNAERGRLLTEDPDAAADADDDPILSDDALPSGEPLPDGTVIPGNQPNDPDAPAQSPGGAPTGGTPLTCYGPTPSLDADFAAFCAFPNDARRQAFATAFDLVCNQRKLINLALAPCSWTGAGEKTKFRRVLQKTALDDQAAQDFRFLAAYAVTSESKLEDHAALILREMNDPNYGQTFVTIKNSKVYDVVAKPDGSFDYTADFASSAARVSFRANLSIAQITPRLWVAFDYAFDGFVLVKEHRFLRLLVRLDDKRTRLVALDEKLVSDAGNHPLAYQNLMDVLEQRMGRDHENSRRD